MFPLHLMSDEDKERFAYDLETKPTGIELDSFPEIRDAA